MQYEYKQIKEREKLTMVAVIVNVRRDVESIGRRAGRNPVRCVRAADQFEDDWRT